MKRELKDLIILPSAVCISLAAAQIPMKRELKGHPWKATPWCWFAAAQIPMKRELKVSQNEIFRFCFFELQPKSLWRGNWKLLNRRELDLPVFRCSPNPYEEGTERWIILLAICRFTNLLQPKSLWRGNWKEYQLVALVAKDKLQPKSLWRGNWKPSCLL